uniref:NB-ARC domain-containing protein n=1 Tax=Leersia perrieri TaxID=77586 RepID=A0A0D9WLR6_9ORYZ
MDSSLTTLEWLHSISSPPILKSLYLNGYLKEIDWFRELKHLVKIYLIGSELNEGIIGIKHLPKLKEISLDWHAKVARLGKLQEEMEANPNRPVLQMRRDPTEHDLGDIDIEGSTIPVEAQEPLPMTVGESSQSNQGAGDEQQPNTSAEITPADADPTMSDVQYCKNNTLSELGRFDRMPVDQGQVDTRLSNNGVSTSL